MVQFSGAGSNLQRGPDHPCFQHQIHIKTSRLRVHDSYNHDMIHRSPEKIGEVKMHVHNPPMQPISTSKPARTDPVPQHSQPLAGESQQQVNPIPPSGRPTSLKLTRLSKNDPFAEPNLPATERQRMTNDKVYQSVGYWPMKLQRKSMEILRTIR